VPFDQKFHSAWPVFPFLHKTAELLTPISQQKENSIRTDGRGNASEGSIACRGRTVDRGLLIRGE